MPFSNNISQHILKLMFTKDYSFPTVNEVWMALSTNNPETATPPGTFQEMMGDTYKRVLLIKNGDSYPDYLNDPEVREVSNKNQINWTKAQTDWPRLQGFALFTRDRTKQETDPMISADNVAMLYYGALELSDEDKAAGGLEVKAGAVALFDPEAFKIQVSTSDTPITATAE